MSTESTGIKLKLGEKFSYGFGNFGLGIIMFMTSTYLLFFYADVIGLSPALVGLAVMIGKIWDAVSDPMMGFISDRTRSRWGRRRVFLLFASIPTAVIFYFTWSPPAFMTAAPGAALFIYLLVAWLLLMTGFTVMAVPFYSLGAELSTDPDERSKAFAFSNFGYRIGQLLAIAAANAAIEFADKVIAFLHDKIGLFSDQSAARYIEFFADPTNAIRWVGGLFGIIMTAAFMITFFGSKERVTYEPEKKIKGAKQTVKYVFGDFASKFKNKAFLILIISTLVADINAGIIFSMFPYSVKYWLHMEALFTPLFLIITIFGGFFAFVWVKISQKKGKKWAFLAAQLIYAIVAAGMFLFKEGPNPWIFMAYMLGFAVGISGYVMVWSLIADVADFDEYETHTRREGSFYGLYTLSNKTATAIGVGLSGIFLSIIGLEKGVEITPHMITLLKFFFGPVVGVINLIGFFIFLKFPFSTEDHKEIQRKLELRRQESPNKT